VIQVASVCTVSPSLRSEIDGWTFEDASLLVKKSRPGDEYAGKIFIGYTPAPKNIPRYTCLLEMLADGWELLGAPQREAWEADGKQHEQWGWWLQRKPQPQPEPSE